MTCATLRGGQLMSFGAPTGTSVSISPWSELLIGYGVSPVEVRAAEGSKPAQ